MPETPTLFAITGHMLLLEAALTESEGEITPEIESLLAAVELHEPVKIESYCHLIQQWEMEAKKIGLAASVHDDEAARLRQREKRKQDTAKRLRGRLHDHLCQTGQQKIATDEFTVWRQRNSQPKIECTVDLADVPESFLKVKMVSELDRQAILDTWRKELPLPEGVAVVLGETLRIK